MSFILKGNNIEIAAPVYSHDNSRYHVRNHFFFATKHSTWPLFVNTQLGLHHITCFKLIHRNPQNGQFGCSSCAAMLSFLSFRWLLFLNCNCNFVGQQFLNEAMTSEHLASLLSYLNTIYFQFLSGNWNLLPKKIASVWKRNGYPKFIKSRVETN